MKVLFIGGTGNISSATSRLAVEKGIELFLLNRGMRKIKIRGAQSLVADVHDPAATASVLKGHRFDAVVNWVAFNTEDVKRDYQLFREITDHYIFISSASVYQKPATTPFITESTPLANPYWTGYSDRKIECELYLNELYRKEGFPVTIVRPSLTYDTVFPVAIGSWDDFTLVDRIRKGKKIIVHGDGTSLWTCTHSKDFAKGFVGLLGNPQTHGHAFHITSDEVLTWDQIYQTIAAAAGGQANIVHIASDFIAAMEPLQRGNLHGDKAVSAIFDNSKIKRFVPEFKAIIPLREGICQTIRWFEEDESRMVIREDTNRMIDNIIHTYEKALNAIK
jgi:nucleoside-diphosphate-sugar epimerase